MVPRMPYTKGIPQQKGGTTMTQQIRYVGGHFEVYSEAGEFLFSADTVQEAWAELSA